MKRIILAGLVLVALGGCQVWKETRRPGPMSQQNEAASNRQRMESVCGPAGVKQQPGTDGTQAGDWVCGGR